MSSYQVYIEIHPRSLISSQYWRLSHTKETKLAMLLSHLVIIQLQSPHRLQHHSTHIITIYSNLHMISCSKNTWYVFWENQKPGSHKNTCINLHQQCLSQLNTRYVHITYQFRFGQQE